MSKARRRVLLVDDEADVVKVVGKRLETEGFEVVVASTGPEAMAKVEADPPDLMILDVMLPKISGFEVCAKLKRDERFRKIPSIIFTGKGYEGDERLCRELGADAYVAKDRGPTVLIERANALLGGS